jgi:hypothetical protein
MRASFRASPLISTACAFLLMRPLWLCGCRQGNTGSADT